MRGADGRVCNLVAVIDDVTDLKRVEDDLRVARDQAETADRAKGEFLAMMSHELRTPLNGIIGFATLLQDTALTTEQRDYVETVRKSGEALLTLTNELLDYSRIDAGRMQLDPQACSPRQIVEEAVELLSTRAAEKHLELLVAIAPGVPAHVLADPGRLRQVLVNLVGNAIKFTPAGEVEVELAAAPCRPAPAASRGCGWNSPCATPASASPWKTRTVSSCLSARWTRRARASTAAPASASPSAAASCA
ncbi:histidine kinase dimerization/phospho-acceptor domain-containing protein [Oleiharenicola sp. Vm1]|uniref:histidine kinase dimerization/phospho-acceptor domain-containing protein n=1 Tax=Oleiharenicola sp. Vm1 TaxID=3398393 RepID=UPI0039F50D10